jgi:hypothetical protein
MKRPALLAALVICSIMLSSCSSFAYLWSDDYIQAGIRIETSRAAVSSMHAVNRWSTEFDLSFSAHQVGVWAANRLAKQGRHDVVVLVELISTFDPPGRDLDQSENMWRISVYSPAQEELVGRLIRRACRAGRSSGVRCCEWGSASGVGRWGVPCESSQPGRSAAARGDSALRCPAAGILAWVKDKDLP